MLGLLWPEDGAPDARALTVIVAVLGTTISPYLFFWQAAQEVEELNADPAATALVLDAGGARRHLRRIKIDTYFGMGFSNLIALFIVLIDARRRCTAGITNIQTSAQAAEALRPLAGDFAFLFFGWGSSAPGCWPCRCSPARRRMPWRRRSTGRSGSPDSGQRPTFYAIIAVATLGGVILDFTPIDPIKALFWSAVINGVIAVPIMAVMMLLAATQR